MMVIISLDHLHGPGVQHESVRMQKHIDLRFLQVAAGSGHRLSALSRRTTGVMSKGLKFAAQMKSALGLCAPDSVLCRGFRSLSVLAQSW